jgi:hypothetical protein
MKVYKIGYTFKSVPVPPRIIKVIATSQLAAIAKAEELLWWDCISPEEVTINLVGIAPAK